MTSSKFKGTPEENLMAVIFGEEPWDARFPLCYPYIVIEEDWKERRMGLDEALQDALSTLPLVKGRNDPREWDGYKQVLNLRFGLKGGIRRTLKRVSQEIGGIREERVRQIQAEALRLMRHPSRSKQLRKFFVPSPKEIGAIEKELQGCQEALHQALHRMRGMEERTDRLGALLKSAGLSEEDTPQTAQALREAGADQEALRALRSKFPNTRVWSAVRWAITDLSTLRAAEDTPQTAQALREAGADQEALRALRSKFPNTRVWSAVRWADITDLSTLRAAVESGEIRKVRNIGPVAGAFLRRVLQAVEQEVSS